MSNKINIAIVGVGNCASSLCMGLEYYKDIKNPDESIPGLMHPVLGGYKISDIAVKCAFDVDKRKVGQDLSNAIFSPPNNTKKFSNIPFQDVIVLKSPILDGVAPHMRDCFQIDDSQKELSKDDILNELDNKNADLIINYLPVGTRRGTEFWAQVALDSGCAMINCIPEFIASKEEWSNRFRDANIPIIGDDIKSEIGATIINRALVQMLLDRGARIENSWQVNFGGNSDFFNMISQDRLDSKRISKIESVSSLIPYNYASKPYIYAGPNGYIECLMDNKIADLRIDFRIFGDIACSLDCKLSVEDSPNSGGIVIDAIRTIMIAKNKGIGGPINSACAYYMKRPPVQMRDEYARKQLEDFIKDNTDKR